MRESTQTLLHFRARSLPNRAQSTEKHGIVNDVVTGLNPRFPRMPKSKLWRPLEYGAKGLTAGFVTHHSVSSIVLITVASVEKR